MDFSKVKNLAIPEGNVTSISIGGKVVWKKPEEPPAVNSFYIEDASGQPNTLSLTQTGAVPVKLEYSTDNKVWQEWIDCQTTTLPVAANSKVYLRGTNNVFSEDYKNNNKFNCTGEFNVGGDLTTLLVPEGNVLDLTGRNFIFHSLFIQSNVIDAGKLILPAATLANNCYEYMFYNCTSLTTAPELPATTLADNCYGSMFSGCSSLQTAPELPATILANTCYYNMFKGCTSLTKVPDLLATTLAPGCCRNMFRDCTSLTTAPVLPVTELANECYNGMFSGCTSLTTAPELPATKLTVKGYYDMFSGCTSLTTAPELPATELAKDCYNKMFQNCTSLIQAPVLPAMTLSRGCYYDMFSGCGKLNYVKIGTTTWNNIYAYRWLSGTAATGTIEIPAELVTWDGTGTQPEGSIPLNSTNGIPSGWTVEDINPEPVIPPQEPVTTQSFRFENKSAEPRTVGYVTPRTNTNFTNTKFIVSDDGTNWRWWNKVEDFKFEDLTIQPQGTLYVRGADNKALGNSELSWASNRFDIKQPLECHGLINDLCSSSPAPYRLSGLFQDCKITTAPSFKGEISAAETYEYAGMFLNCTELTKFPTESGYNGFWIGGVAADATDSYTAMFRGCSNLDDMVYIDGVRYNDTSLARIFSLCPKFKSITITNLTGWNATWSDNWLDGAAPFGNISANYIHSFIDFPESASGIPTNWTLNNQIRPSKFRFKNISGSVNNIRLNKNGSAPDIVLEKSSDGNIYEPCDIYAGVELQPDETIYFRGSNGTFATDMDNYNYFSSNSDIECAGDIMDLVYLNSNQLNSYQFYKLFYDMYTLTKPPMLPATQLAESCYRYMFSGCGNLKEVPLLPATNLAPGCYMNMFSGCYNITTVPELPARNLADRCYGWMFEGCSNLNYVKLGAVEWRDQPQWLERVAADGNIDAPNLHPASFDLDNGIPSRWTLNGERANQFRIVNTGSSTINIKLVADDPIKSPNVSLQMSTDNRKYEVCDMYTGIPVPGKSSIYLRGANGAFANMVDGLIYSNHFKINGYYSRLKGSVMDLIDNGANTTTLTADYQFAGLFKGYTEPFNVEIPATTLTKGCYKEMFKDSNFSTYSTINLPADVLAEYCYESMFENCTNIYNNYGAKLTASTLAPGCYNRIFAGCVNKNTVDVSAKTWDESYAVDWLTGAAVSGNIVTNTLTWDDFVDGPNGIPTGWTLNGSVRPTPYSHKVEIGNGNVSQRVIPFNVTYKNNFSQTVYKQSDINYAGKINAIAIKSKGYENIGDITVWLGHTSNADASGNFVTDQSKSQVVYHNSLQMSSGDIYIPLDTTFEYNNVDNLLISFGRKDSKYHFSGDFYATAVTNGSVAKGNDGDVTAGDWPTTADGKIDNNIPNIIIYFE